MDLSYGDLNKILWIFCIIFVSTVHSQAWTWTSGVSIGNFGGSYGVKGQENSSNLPSSRSNSISWVDSSNHLWLFGGKTGTNLALNDLWKWNGVIWTWMSGSNLTNSQGSFGNRTTFSITNVPPSRFSSISWVDDDNVLWLMGGSTQSSSFRNDVWKYDISKNMWSWYTGNQTTGISGKYLGKGVGGNSYANYPGSRYGSATWVSINDQSKWLFGGSGIDSNGNSGFLNDFWRLDTVNDEWTWINGSSSNNPTSDPSYPNARRQAVSWVDTKNNFWLYGGVMQGLVGASDLWKYVIVGNKWTKISGGSVDQSPEFGTKGSSSSSTTPGSRWSSVSWIDVFDRLWLFGGTDYNQNNWNDLWMFNNNTLQWTWISGHSIPNTEGSRLQLGQTAAENEPSSRQQSISWYSSEGKFLLFGGYGYINSTTKDNLADLWSFDVNWMPVSTGAVSTGLITTGVTTSQISTGIDSTTSQTTPQTTAINAVTTSFAGITTDSNLGSQTTDTQSNVKPPPPKSNKTSTIVGVVLGLVFLILLVVVGLWAFTFIRKKKKKQEEKKDFAEPPLRQESSIQLSSLQLSAIKSKWETLEGIQIKELLGSGNFGEVYRGEWEGTYVALKTVKDINLFNDFLREASIIGSLNHPNVLRYLGVFQQDNQKFIVTEFLAEGSLDVVISREGLHLELRDLIAIAIQAATGMAYLEKRGIIHRDLALRNLLVAKESHKYVVKVADFGLSRNVEQGFYQSNDKHIPYKWTAIESILTGKYTHKSDVWSFGVLLWELFSYGMIPYPGFSNPDVVEKLQTGYRLEKPKLSCTDSIYNIMMSCWYESPDLRPTFAQLVTLLKEELKNEMGEVQEENKEIDPNNNTAISNKNSNYMIDGDFYSPDYYNNV